MLHPSVAAIRLVVRRTLADLAPGQNVLVACSGGADSLALLAAAVFEGRKPGLRVIGATVDHGLQERSADHAARVVEQMDALAVAESVLATVHVEAPGLGPEAAAREARYAILEEVAERLDAAVVLLGHTLDDQAETVLLGLARGSGGRSLAGMRRSFDRYRRPLLDVTRADTEEACRAEGIEFWTDPHNLDQRFTRVRVRTQLMPLLETELGPGVAVSLARTADQLRTDIGYLDAVADEAFEAVRLQDGLALQPLAHLPDAIRRRVLRLAALGAGSPGSELFQQHVLELDRLVTDWHGQIGIDLPGLVRAVREGDAIIFVAGPVAG